MTVRSLYLVLAFACAGLLSSNSTYAGPSSEVCGLYARTDAEGLFGHSVAAGVSRTTVFPAGESCRYSFTENGDSYGITVRISTSAAIRAEGINNSAADVMIRQEKARKAGGHAAKTFQPVPGLGDDAFWNGSDLWVLKKDALVIISVHSVLAGSFKDMAAARAVREKQDLALSEKAAQTILLRLK